MAARKTTADVMREQIEKLKALNAKLLTARDAKIELIQAQYGAELDSNIVQIKALVDTLEKLEAKT